MSKKLTNCKTCGNEISKGAKCCPNCGSDNRKFYAKHKILTGLLALFIIGSVGGGDTDSDYQVTIEKGAYDSSGFAFYVTGTLTNNKKDVDYIQVLIPVYDKNGNKLGDAIANCNNLEKGETWRFEAMAIEDGIAKYSKNAEVTGF